MPKIQPLLGTLHLHFLAPFFLLINTNPNLVEFDMSVVDMDMVT